MVSLYTLDVPDVPGTLADVAEALNNAGINIDAFSAGMGGVRIITDADDGTRKVLDAQSIAYKAEEVIEIELPQRPGELARVARALGQHGVNIHVSVGAGKGNCSIYIGVSDVEGAWEALESLQPVEA